MSRPCKTKLTARNTLMQTRLTPAESDTFKAAAERCGLELSSWVRERLLAAARRELNGKAGAR